MGYLDRECIYEVADPYAAGFDDITVHVARIDIC